MTQRYRGRTPKGQSLVDKMVLYFARHPLSTLTPREAAEMFDRAYPSACNVLPVAVRDRRLGVIKGARGSVPRYCAPGAAAALAAPPQQVSLSTVWR